MTTRVHLLAASLGVSCKVILQKCQDNGFDVKNHMSILSGRLVEAILGWFGHKETTPSTASSPHANGPHPAVPHAGTMNVQMLAAALGIRSQTIVVRCWAEGLDVTDHLSLLSSSMQAKIRGWFARPHIAMPPGAQTPAISSIRVAPKSAPASKPKNTEQKIRTNKTSPGAQTSRGANGNFMSEICGGFQVMARGLGRFIDLQMTDSYGANWEQVANQALAKDSSETDRKTKEWILRDPYCLLLLLLRKWETMFACMMPQLDRRVISQLKSDRDRWAHFQPFSHPDAYAALRRITQLLVASQSRGEAMEVEQMLPGLARRNCR